MRMPLARAVCVACLVGVVVALPAAEPGLSRAKSDAFVRKVNQLAEPTGASAQRRVALSEAEMNSWFAFDAVRVMPAGVTDPTVSMIGAGRVAGRVVVDLDRVPRKRNPNLFDPWSLLSGRVPVQVRGTLRTQGGQGTFALESAQLAGITVPKFLLQELLAAYSRSARNPEGLNLDAPFSLPVRIQRIDVEPGQALVVQ